MRTSYVTCCGPGVVFKTLSQKHILTEEALQKHTLTEEALQKQTLQKEGLLCYMLWPGGCL